MGCRKNFFQGVKMVKFHFANSKLRKKISTKYLMGKYQISKSKGLALLYPPSDTHAHNPVARSFPRTADRAHLYFGDLCWGWSRPRIRQLFRLTNLRTLIVSFCCLTSLPMSLFSLTSLEFLDVSYNKLTFLPNEMRRLENLRSVGGGSHRGVSSSIVAWINLHCSIVAWINQDYTWQVFQHGGQWADWPALRDAQIESVQSPRPKQLHAPPAVAWELHQLPPTFDGPVRLEAAEGVHKRQPWKLLEAPWKSCGYFEEVSF